MGEWEACSWTFLNFFRSSNFVCAFNVLWGTGDEGNDDSRGYSTQKKSAENYQCLQYFQNHICVMFLLLLPHSFDSKTTLHQLDTSSTATSARG